MTFSLIFYFVYVFIIIFQDWNHKILSWEKNIDLCVNKDEKLQLTILIKSGNKNYIILKNTELKARISPMTTMNKR